MIPRSIKSHIVSSLEHWPVTLVTGARQVGKSTICQEIAAEKGMNYISLDNPLERRTAVTDPMMFLKLHPAPVVIDEIQYAPGLFDAIEYEVNKRKSESKDNSGMYLLTGSQSYLLMEGITESLAGRINILRMSGLSMREIRSEPDIPFRVNDDSPRPYRMEPAEIYSRMIRGFFPKLYDDREMDTEEYYRNYVDTYLQRDVSQIINVKDKLAFTEFLSVAASLTGEELVYETLAKAVRVSAKTIKSWINVLEAGHIVRLMKPYHDTSMINRVVKHPKLYFTDTGLACFLMGIHDPEVLGKSIYKGCLFETYAVNEIIKSYDNNSKSCDFSYFRDNNGNEIDLLMLRDNKVSMVECKSGVLFTKSDVSAFKQLKAGSREIEGGCIICNTDVPYSVTEDAMALPVTFI